MIRLAGGRFETLKRAGPVGGSITNGDCDAMKMSAWERRDLGIGGGVALPASRPVGFTPLSGQTPIPARALSLALFGSSEAAGPVAVARPTPISGGGLGTAA